MFPGNRLYCGGVNNLPSDLDPPATGPAVPGDMKKRALIVDQEDDAFGVEYDNTIGTKNTMRLDATTYEDAIVETKSFLGITENRDEEGTLWEID